MLRFISLVVKFVDLRNFCRVLSSVKGLGSDVLDLARKLVSAWLKKRAGGRKEWVARGDICRKDADISFISPFCDLKVSLITVSDDVQNTAMLDESNGKVPHFYH